MSLAALLEKLPIPIVQAPMAYASAADMALAVSRAGGLGSLPAAPIAPAEIGLAVAALKAQTDAPFAVNLLMTPPSAPSPQEVESALARLAPWYAEVGAPLPAALHQYGQDFTAQLEALTQAAPPVASFAFSVLSKAQVEALHRAGTYVVGTANTVAEARAWAEAGADGICAQGSEAGGHRGNFLAEIDASLVGTMALVVTVRQAVDLPVIAAGGIMDGRGVAAALALGASAAQMGTAFLLADQAVNGAVWQAAIRKATDDPTRLTRAFTGRYARGLENRFMREMRAVEDDVPAYPVQGVLTGPMRRAAEAAGNQELMVLWAGQAVKLAGPGDAGELMRRWWAEAGETARALAARTGASPPRP
ncbi:NAD(P)H-dependent flavin oxidoreductase [Phenylobacterium sp.]|jgi:nitronate monooxygenase|uniref:NAD(P)H-dependent flavin oxidoreductase n=1 Tax=Phenylobacterium sp. TaxID=1871053 RepID=UPI002E2F04AF|nr:nitronate monooxygenase [Phenylobacterium sp.]HEX4709858.1 nitronate monooxygenase [Phenylobacterium sp.]